MNWDCDIPSKEIIDKNKEILAKWPFLEHRNLYSGEGYKGEERYYSTDWNDWDGTGWEKIWKLFITKLGAIWEKLPDDDYKKKFQILDTKEKYGTLRVSLSGYTEKMMDLEWALEHESRYICINCGKQPKDSKGHRFIWTSHGWIMPFCKECARKDYQSHGQLWKNFYTKDFMKDCVIKSNDGIKIIPSLTNFEI